VFVVRAFRVRVLGDDGEPFSRASMHTSKDWRRRATARDGFGDADRGGETLDGPRNGVTAAAAAYWVYRLSLSCRSRFGVYVLTKRVEAREHGRLRLGNVTVRRRSAPYVTSVHVNRQTCRL